jgi:hypothetical protein
MHMGSVEFEPGGLGLFPERQCAVVALEFSVVVVAQTVRVEAMGRFRRLDGSSGVRLQQPAEA